MHKPRLVVIVDDDESVRDSLPELVRHLGYEPKTFASAEQFLTSGVVTDTQCLILDIGLPGMSGPELQQILRRGGFDVPTIFATGRSGNVPSSLLAESVGPCLFKPFSDHDLQAALDAAMRKSD
jgi:FixJ family two-component response regulator